MAKKDKVKETEEAPKEEQGNRKKESGEKKTADSKPKKLSVLMKVLIVVLIVLIIIVTAFFISKSVLLPKYQQYKVNKEFVEKKKKPEKEKAEVREIGQIYEIKDLTVNTFGSGGRRFVVAEFALETHSEEAFKELGMRSPQIRDMIINYLRHYTADEILSLSFQEKSRSELTLNVNRLLHTGKVDSLYFITLVLQ